MKTTTLFIVVLIVALLSACTPSTPAAVTQPAISPAAPTNTPAVIVSTAAPTTAAPTSAPTAAPTEAPTAVLTTAPTTAPTSAPTTSAPTSVGLVVKTADQKIQIVSVALPLTSAYQPAFTALNSQGGVIQGTPYVYDFTTFPTVMAVDVNGAVQQEYVKNPTYGLAVYDGAQPRLAWGTQLIVPNSPSSLQISAPDGSQLETLFLQGVTVPPVQVVALFFSEDGNSIYFSRETVGRGGYIVFDGMSSLYKLDIASKQEIELVPVSQATTACLDAISLDHRYLADHCSLKEITIRDLTSGATTTIQTPEGLTGFGTLGSARFSPDGSRVAFALAKNNPDSEQGWIAVSDGLQGASKLILTSDAGVDYQVVGWLNEQTLLIQSNPVPACETCGSQLWTVNIDGSSLTKVADGRFLTVKDAH